MGRKTHRKKFSVHWAFAYKEYVQSIGNIFQNIYEFIYLKSTSNIHM